MIVTAHHGDCASCCLRKTSASFKSSCAVMQVLYLCARSPATHRDHIDPVGSSTIPYRPPSSLSSPRMACFECSEVNPHINLTATCATACVCVACLCTHQSRSKHVLPPYVDNCHMLPFALTASWDQSTRSFVCRLMLVENTCPMCSLTSVISCAL